VRRQRYQPPRQSNAGQFVDCVFLLVLVYLSLMLPILVGGGARTPETVEAAAPTWEALGQNATMQAQWEKLGYDAASAKPLIESRFDYTVNPWMLALTALVIVAYFVFVFRVSEKEYREVIAERFDDET
jgi:hypothetical protein